ncbi:TonB-dependent receptor domain-containing protein, partial [Pantoea endophytica]
VHRPVAEPEDDGRGVLVGLGRLGLRGVAAQQPQTALKLFTSYTPQSLQELTVGGGANWQNRIYYAVPAYCRIEQSGYALVSAFVRYRISPEFSVQANLNNLLAKKYLSQINGYGAYGDGRNGSLTFTWSF